MVRTQGFHPCNRSSILLGVTFFLMRKMVFWKVFIILLNIFPNPFVRLANIFVKKTKIKNSFYLSNSKQKIPLKVYLSNNKQKTPTLILFPGATPLGEDHLMLNKFAK